MNIPSFMVKVESQKHIDFSLTSPFGGGRPGRVSRRKERDVDREEREEVEALLVSVIELVVFYNVCGEELEGG